MNNQIFFFFYNLAHQSPIFDIKIIFTAIYLIYVVIVATFLFLVFHNKVLPSPNPIKEFVSKWREFVVFFVSGGLAWVSANVLKFLIHTPRPFDIFLQVHPLFAETGYAFPSGHTTLATALAFAVFFTNKKAGYVFMFLALLIGLSRITAGVHFPIDILGGFILGVLVAYLVKYVYNIVILCGKK